MWDAHDYRLRRGIGSELGRKFFHSMLPIHILVFFVADIN